MVDAVLYISRESSLTAACDMGYQRWPPDFLLHDPHLPIVYSIGL
jgi:hypothetical protein